MEIADQRGAMESIWHGCMELNQTYMNDYTTLMVRITKLKQMQSGAGQALGVVWRHYLLHALARIGVTNVQIKYLRYWP